MRAIVRPTEIVKAEIKDLVSRGLLDKEDRILLSSWVSIVEEHGHEILAKIRKSYETKTLELRQMALEREPSNVNHFNDHALEGAFFGFRSSSFSQLGRLIYKVNKNEIEIVSVERVTIDHDYKRRK